MNGDDKFVSATGVMASTCWGAVMRSTDAGASWNRIVVGAQAAFTFAFADASDGFASGVDYVTGNEDLLRTTDGGATWGATWGVTVRKD